MFKKVDVPSPAHRWWDGLTLVPGLALVGRAGVDASRMQIRRSRYADHVGRTIAPPIDGLWCWEPPIKSS